MSMSQIASAPTRPASLQASMMASSAAPDGSTGFSAALNAYGQGAAAGDGRPAFSLNSRTEAETRAAIHKSAGDFEASCMGQLLGFMNQDLAVDPNFGGGRGEEMYRDMMNTEYGKLAHRSGTVGIAAQVERELLRAQGLKPLKGVSLEA